MVSTETMQMVLFVMGVFLLWVGVYGTVYPYKAARFQEQIDAIGSKTGARTIEPTDWNVTFARILSIVLAIMGVVILGLLLTTIVNPR